MYVKSRGTNITNEDRLQFVEAILSNEVKSLYRALHDILTRSEPQSRNSILRVVDFYNEVADIFHDK